MLYLFLLILLLIGKDIYNRYVPVQGINAVVPDQIQEQVVLLDLRDYQTTYKCPICDSVNIPFAYLKRYYHEIPSNKKIVILATDAVEKNLAIRFLMRKNFKIQGFMVLNEEKRGEKQWNMISKQKTV